MIFVLLYSNPLNAQEVDAFYTNKTLCDTCENELSFNIESISFIKNNEYSNPFTDGFTGLGTFLKPTAEYYFNENTRINVGAFLIQYYGLDDFSDVQPIITIQHRVNDNLDLIFGSIYGNLNHNLEEPLYRFDRYYQNNVENGVQLLYNSEKFESDLWLNWEQFIFRDEPIQEEFEVGSVSELNLFSDNNFEINLPLQFLIYHKGGDIDTSPDPILSILNGVAGLDFQYQLNNKNLISIEPSVYLYSALTSPNDPNSVNAQAFENGSAFYLKAKYKTEKFDASVGIWSANEFIAPRGEFLFSSISDNNSFTQEDRTVIPAKVGYTHPISEAIKIAVRADAYYDVDNTNLDYSNGVYFIIDESFFIKKIHPKREGYKNR